MKLYKRLRTIILKINKKIKFYIYKKNNNIRIVRGTSIASDVKIGRYTRINAKSHIGSCQIGAFCAIAGRLTIRSSDHYTCYLNMQDYFQRSILNSNIKVAGKTKGRVVIGNGVWIGDSVIILSGVTIGNGAVIGAGSIVTKPIPAYAIAVGNPAKVIKYRFEKNIRDTLEKIAWWEWSIKKMKDNKLLFETDLSDTTLTELQEVLKIYE